MTAEARRSPGHPGVLLDIVEEHFEELDFLWEQRERVIFAEDWTRSELVVLEARAEAHLDALRLAEGHALDLARPALAGDATFAATAATLVMLDWGVPELSAEVLEGLSKAEAPETREGIRIGLRHAPLSDLREGLLGLAAGSDLALAAIAADVLAFQRVAVPGLERLLAADAAESRALVFGALGRLARLVDARALEAGLEDASAAVRTAALQAAARSGLPGLAERCRRPDAPPEALAFLGLLGDPADRAHLQAAVADPQRAAAALRGLGALGSIRAIPDLLELLDDSELAVAAAAAFQRITGAEDLAAEAAAPAAADETEAAAEEADDIEAEFADEAAPPDPARARAWWQARASSFAPEGRWQAGSEVGQPGAWSRDLPLGVRRDVWLSARAHDPAATPDLELEARGGGV
jgi:uncharacterized protein (TIGR02270 family)